MTPCDVRSEFSLSYSMSQCIQLLSFMFVWFDGRKVGKKGKKWASDWPKRSPHTRLDV